MSDPIFLQRNPQRHAAGWALVVALHLLLLWAIQSGLSRLLPANMQTVVDVLLLPQDKRPALQAAPTPTPPTQSPPMARTPVTAPETVPPLPTTPSTAPSTAAPALATANASPPQPVAPAAPAIAPAAPVKHEPVRTAAAGVLCPKPAYPRAAARMEEEGAVSLTYVVGVDGQVGRVEVTKSSGYKRLDNAALEQLRLWRFKPATLDGKPIEQTRSTQMVFKLTDDAPAQPPDQSAC